MKKILALALALMLCLCSVAFADTAVDTSNWVSTGKEDFDIKINKLYTVEGETDGDIYPTETLSFKVVAGDDNPSTPSPDLTVDDLTVTSQTVNALYVNVPSYDKVGVYTYTITEDAGNAQGVTKYSDAEIVITILVEYDYENTCLKVAEIGVTEGEEGKEDDFVNTFELGNLTVSKEVTGNLGDKNKEFDITVTFSATKNVENTITYYKNGSTTSEGTIGEDEWTDGKAEVVISLKHGDSIEFTDIPDGVTYTVVESDEYSKESDKNLENSYDAPEYEESDTTYTIRSGDDDTVKVINNKETEIATGIAMDSAPYMIVLALVVVAGVMMMKKRSYNA